MRFVLADLSDGLSVKGRGAWKAVNKQVAKHAANPDDARIRCEDDLVEVRGLPAEELALIRANLAEKK